MAQRILLRRCVCPDSLAPGGEWQKAFCDVERCLMNRCIQLRSGHGIIRKFVLVFEAFFNLLALVFAWFGVVSEALLLVFEPELTGSPISGKLLLILCSSIPSTLGNDT